VVAYSSLAIVLLTATLAASGAIPLDVALGLVLGANLGSGLLACWPPRSTVEVRQVPMGNLVFKLLGRDAGGALRRPVAAPRAALPGRTGDRGGAVPPDLQRADRAVFIGLDAGRRALGRKLAAQAGKEPGGRPAAPPGPFGPGHAVAGHLLPAREALHQADVVETMLLGMLRVIKDNDLRLAEELRKMDDTVDQLYSAIKYYLTKISREALGEEESRRWTDIISFTINMEQIGDIIERILIDIEDKKIKKGRSFSDAGMAEICELHARLVDNLRLGMSVFLNGSVRDAQKLLEEKARFRDLERAYAGTHLTRLSDNTVQSIETSSLHLDLISDLKRINSHICSIAYPILDSAGALAPSRLRAPALTDQV
jgi:phosphate:Na+ symporter